LGAIALMLVVVFTNQFIPLCVLMGLPGPRGCEVSLAPIQVVLFSILALLLLGPVFRRREESALLAIWKKNWLVGVFLGLALLSNLWSVRLPMTIFRSATLLLLTLIASYFGASMKPRDLTNFVVVAIGVIAFVSLALGIFLPELAIMANHPYEGLWRGVYWHKVYLGASMALGYIACLTILFSSRKSYPLVPRIFAGGMLLICLTLAILSDSASGLMVIAIQTGLFALLLMWLAWGHLINRRAYILLAVLMAGLLVFALLNLDFIFGLFNRSASMTGRIPLWVYLLERYIAQRPLFGYGVGSFWYQPGVSVTAQTVVGWGYPIGVSDNGYMDILLGLGASGLVLFLSILLVGLWRTINHGIQTRDLVSFFPFLLIVHIATINLSLSYFLESESFLWFLLALVMFMSIQKEENKQKRTSPA
jgi:exopolysaccharide production protein ExoQ